MARILAEAQIIVLGILWEQGKTTFPLLIRSLACSFHPPAHHGDSGNVDLIPRTPFLLMALSILLAGAAGILGILFEENPIAKNFSISVICISSVIAIILAHQTEKDSRFSRRALENLVRAVKPSELVRDAIFGEIKKLAGERGHPVTQIIEIKSCYYLRFYVSEVTGPKSSIVISTEMLAHFALYGEEEIRRKILDHLERFLF